MTRDFPDRLTGARPEQPERIAEQRAPSLVDHHSGSPRPARVVAIGRGPHFDQNLVHWVIFLLPACLAAAIY